jgi:hypothetical protein
MVVVELISFGISHPNIVALTALNVIVVFVALL